LIEKWRGYPFRAWSCRHHPLPMRPNIPTSAAASDRSKSVRQLVFMAFRKPTTANGQVRTADHDSAQPEAQARIHQVPLPMRICQSEHPMGSKELGIVQHLRTIIADIFHRTDPSASSVRYPGSARAVVRSSHCERGGENANLGADLETGSPSLLRARTRGGCRGGGGGAGVARTFARFRGRGVWPANRVNCGRGGGFVARRSCGARRRPSGRASRPDIRRFP